MKALKNTLGVAAAGLRLGSGIAQYAPLIALALLFLPPEGPHLRWEYQYTENAGTRFYMRCSYLGSRGLIAPAIVDHCPLLAWLEAQGARP